MHLRKTIAGGEQAEEPEDLGFIAAPKVELKDTVQLSEEAIAERVQREASSKQSAQAQVARPMTKLATKSKKELAQALAQHKDAAATRYI